MEFLRGLQGPLTIESAKSQQNFGETASLDQPRHDEAPWRTLGVDHGDTPEQAWSETPKTGRKSDQTLPFSPSATHGCAYRRNDDAINARKA